MLTPEQQKNEDIAQAIRFGTPPQESTTPETPETAPVEVPTLNNRGGINKVSNREETGEVSHGTTGINRTIKTPTSDIPDFYGEAYKDVSRDAQKRINSINQYAAEKLQSLQPRQDERLRETSSINTLTGLAGSTEANRTTEKTTAVNKQEDDLVRKEAEMQVATIMDGLSTKALEKATYDREQFTLEADQAAANRTARIEEDTQQATVLAQSGVTAEGLKATDPEGYQYLAESLGGEEVLKATFTLNRPQEQILDKRIENGKYVIAYQNPIDGKVRIETVDLGLPVGYTKTVDAGNRILAIPDDWDGDPSKLVTINKGLTPSQQLSGGGSGEPSGSVVRDVDSIMNGSLNLQDISVKDNYRAIVAGELNKRVKEAEESGDIYGMMAGSAAYDKEVSDSFLSSMEKTVAVLGQMGVLQQNIAGSDTGPIVGAFRAKNPWDTNAQTIKAQLNAIVPNLARGVYGEVGVLTDNDIRTYSKTIPNLTSTEDVRNAVLYITIDMIKRNIETKIKTQAAGQRDMSKFASIYKDVSDTANTVLASLPQSSVPGGEQPTTTLTGPDGQQFDASDLTPEELQEALAAGYTQG